MIPLDIEGLKLLEARNRKIFYDPIIHLHFAELKKKKK